MPNPKQTWSDKDLEILRSRLDDFRATRTRNEKRELRTEVYELLKTSEIEAYPLHRAILIKVHLIELEIDYNSYTGQRIKEWYNNHARQRKPTKLVKFGKKMDVRTLWAKEHSEEIQAEKQRIVEDMDFNGNEGARSKAMQDIGTYQRALKNLFENISEEERERYERLVEEYQENGLSEELKRRSVISLY